MKNTTTLAIDTSCDETSVAVVRGTTVLSNVIASQAQLHKQYGGVFPTIAKQAHQANIDPTILAALHRAQVDWKDIDAVVVTQGPGLAPALEVGLQRAKELAEVHDKPLIPINHIEGHILSVLAQRNTRNTNDAQKSLVEDISFPVLSIIVSGGHTEFILVEKIGQYTKIGQTVDDAAGECLDKVGRMLGLGYPAGAIVEKLAETGDAQKYPFPLPMTTTQDCNLSFSGMKTHARREIEKLEKKGDLSKQVIKDFSASLQHGVIRHLLYKLNKALEKHPEVTALWLGGGVAANQTLRKELRALARKNDLTVRVPYDKKLCGDNAAMIGLAANVKKQGTSNKKTTKSNQNSSFDRKPRWSVDSL